MMNSSEREVRVSQEGDKMRGWSGHKNPRIVRVSRSFGGKDRHSKVSTVKGLRDRRIRLSVPTAIQIYDLQHKLGLSQPSKAVDWLLDNTKNDIDQLPPLPAIPAANQSHFLSSNHPCNMIDERRQKDKWIHQENHDGFGAQNFFPLGTLNQPSFPSMPYNPNFHWDHPNLSLSHIGGVYPLPNQAVEYQSRNVNPSSSQMYFCPTATTIPAFPTVENLQQNPLFPAALHLSSQNVNSKSVHPHQNDTARSGKEE